MKKLINYILIAATMFSAPTFARSCDFELVIDLKTFNVKSLGQTPMSWNVSVMQILDLGVDDDGDVFSIAIFDNMKIIVANKRKMFSHLQRGSELRYIGSRYLGLVSTTTLQNRQGFNVEKDLYVMIDKKTFLSCPYNIRKQ